MGDLEHACQRRLRGVVPFLVALIVAASGGVALADNVVNDVTTGGTDTIAAGDSTTVKYKIVSTGGDGQAGCNASDGTAATATIAYPADVSATPDVLTFTACNAQLSVAFTSNTPGDYTITVSVSDAGSGTYNTVPATFTLHVLDVTPPDTTITAAPSDPSDSTGASFSFTGADDFTAAGDLAFQCELDGGGFSACASPASYSGLAAGSHTFRVRALDEAGNTDASPASFTWTIDLTSPAIKVSDETPSPGGSMTVSGFGFAPGTEIRITFESAPVLLAVTVAGAAGEFSVEVTIPGDAPPGVHSIKATGLGADGQVRVLSRAVIVAPSDSETRSLAATGLPLLAWIIVGCIALALGLSTRYCALLEQRR